LPEPSIIDGENFVKCILPRNSEGTVKASDDLQKILKLFTTADELAVSDIMAVLHMPRATATRRLNKLVKNKTLIRLGSGRGTKYKKRVS
jgi:Fic family protein